MTEKLAHGGWPGVPQSVFDNYEPLEDIEELDASLPEKPCPKCGGMGWIETLQPTGYCEFTRCDCQREERRTVIDPTEVMEEHETYRVPYLNDGRCYECAEPWPCEVYQLAAALQQAQAAMERDWAAWQELAKAVHPVFIDVLDRLHVAERHPDDGTGFCFLCVQKRSRFDEALIVAVRDLRAAYDAMGGRE